MESMNNIGELKLPVGFRFRPTDSELVLHYLKRKVFAIPLPAFIIPDFDVFHAHPTSFPGDLREQRYFFSKRSGNIVGQSKKCRRVAGFGYWKPIGKEKQIVNSETNQLIGMRKTLFFCNGKRFQGTKTRWVLHEFRLVSCEKCTNSNTQISKINELGDWMVYRLFQRKRRPKSNNTNE